MKTPPEWIPNAVSVIVRFHDPKKMAQLDQAISSLEAQRHRLLQVILRVQNGNDALIQELQTLLQKKSFAPELPPSVLSVSIPSSEDGRTRLLNSGMEAARGQYLAFLDYDDIVYPHAYQTLIQRIKNSTCPIVVGGCILVHLNKIRPYVGQRKNKLDLIAHNFIPIHSFLLDRLRIDPTLLRFNPELTRFEDYEFLLKLAARYEFDFELWNTPVAEYRIHADGSNTIPTETQDPQKQAEWDHALQLIQELKKNLTVSVQAQDIQKLVDERDQLLSERGSLPLRAVVAIFERRKNLQSFLAKFKPKF